ncbi:MAG: hypothetical protein ACUVQQ_14060 [Thermogutta sp.]
MCKPSFDRLRGKWGPLRGREMRRSGLPFRLPAGGRLSGAGVLAIPHPSPSTMGGQCEVLGQCEVARGSLPKGVPLHLMVRRFAGWRGGLPGGAEGKASVAALPPPGSEPGDKSCVPLVPLCHGGRTLGLTKSLCVGDAKTYSGGLLTTHGGVTWTLEACYRGRFNDLGLQQRSRRG